MPRVFSHPRDRIGRISLQPVGVPILRLLALPVLLCLLALSLDGASWLASQRHAAAAADAGALAGALAAVQKRPPAGRDVTSLARQVAQENGYDEREGDRIEVNHPPRTGPHAGNQEAVEVIIKRPAEAYLAHYLVRGDKLVVAARAVARADGAGTLDSRPEPVSVSLVE